MNHLLTIADAVATHARLSPHKVGLQDSTRALTFNDWNRRACQLANGLLDLGLNKGDRVALLAYNCIEWAEIYIGLARAGLVAVPINFRLTGPEIAYIIEHSEASAVIVQDALMESVASIRSQLKLAEHGYVLIGQETPGWLAYETLLGAASSNPPAVTVTPEDPFALMYTSGTTGRPKGAIRSHAGNALLAFATALEFGFGRDDRGLIVMPMCHANSLYFSLTFIYLGASIIIEDRKSFDPEHLLAMLSSEKVTFTSLVPTHYIMMLGLPEAVLKKYDVSSVEKLLVSSAPARRETKLAIMNHFKNSRLFELYGATELGWVTILRPEEQLEKLGSVGREWAGSGAIRLLDPTGREVPDGDVGELYSRTSYVYDGYWKNPEKTAESFHGAWCSVGDLARRDADGYIHLVDRKSNMIISGGENIYPSEVESAVGAHPAVKDVAVFGIPDSKWGETVHAAVVLHPDRSVTTQELSAWCAERLARFKIPRSFSFLLDKDMPRTATGKILHRTLRDRFIEERRQA
ncbi:class I adenylate-forming enzyme family protein [Noviherbaspirillum suwonense]|uniref:Acyl-CoA synthetase (AMP-forming)/AMP-acid ligase II n=1 Tax=Noviherbaspirillum suwonense TaxID=1224511 RepID=A0ABY1QC22_9BURK|nr:AMP-binding protein [Noviherbaspirillum suwonense]SMP67054.1 Acyl-CoA synthetase (AMP-forming)/AMP-acid ligase II [Noviherbaspirillum suwonense]